MATDELLNEIRALIGEREELGIRGLTDRLGPSDWADIVQRLDEDEVAVLLESIDPDDATDIVAELPSEDREQILGAMEPDEAAEIRLLSAYPPDTAGGRMTPAFVAISPDVRADDAIVLLRRVAEEAETIYYVYVIDADERLLGVLSLHNLVLTRSQTPVSAVMVADPIRVRADADQETAANLLVDKNLLALPVVDDRDHLLGIITQDDVADVLEEETTEDFERIGGSQ